MMTVGAGAVRDPSDNDAFAIFPGVFDGAYVIYRISGWIRPSTDDVELCLQLGTANGTAWDDSSNSYRWVSKSLDNDGEGHTGDQSSSDRIEVIHRAAGSGIYGVGNAVDKYAYIDLTITAPADAGMVTMVRSEGSYTDERQDVVWVDGAGRSNEPAKAHDSLRLYFNNGSVAAGSLRVYGIQ